MAKEVPITWSRISKLGEFDFKQVASQMEDNFQP